VLVHSFPWAPRIRTIHPRFPSPQTICIRGASLPGQFLDSTKVPKIPPCWQTCKSRHSRGHKDTVACPHFPGLDTISIPGAFLKTVSDSTKVPETPSDRPTCKYFRHKDIPVATFPHYPSPKTNHILLMSPPKQLVADQYFLSPNHIPRTSLPE